MTDLFGRAVVPASPLVVRESLGGGAIRATFGRRGIASSASAALQSFLVNKLKARLPTGGSTLFATIWKETATPAGRSVYLLRASGHRTSGNGCGSWPSPMAGTPAQKGYNEAGSTDYERKVDTLMGLRETPNGRKLAGWRSPSIPTGGGSNPEARIAGGHMLNLHEQCHLASWPTPMDSDSDKGIRTAEGAAKEFARKGTGADLPTLASWATPTSRDHKDGDATSCENVPINSLLGRQIHLSGSPAETAKPGLPPATSAHSLGQLNPAFSRWLQGYPKGWCAAAIRAHRSMRTRRRKPG